MTQPASSSSCRDFRTGMPNRRHLLQIGGAGLLGLGLPHLLEASERRTSKVRAKSVIFLHQWGGPSHVDTFDMKPDAPEAIRGEFKPIQTKAPGVVICDRLPAMAPLMDKVCQVRGIYHTMKNHNSAGYYSLTGCAPPTDDQRLRDSLDLFPAYGSIVDRLAPARAGMPTFVSFPHIIRDGSVTPGQHASFLGKAHDPFFISQDPSASDFRLPELSLPDRISFDRLNHRREVMRLIDQQTDLMERSATARGIDQFQEKAISMLTTPAIKRAFDLSAEPDAVRERYGRTTYGQSCLLARRLVEAGARFVNVYFAASIGGRKNNGGWDTHGFDNNPMYPILKEYLLPITNQTLPTLLTDLEERGLLNDTLVVWMGEFGRSPRINALAGRDHWPQCYTALLAGGGVKRGYVHGSSDRIGAYPASEACRPDDIAATMFELLGIDPHTEIRDALNRPMPISRGNPLVGVMA